MCLASLSGSIVDDGVGARLPNSVVENGSLSPVSESTRTSVPLTGFPEPESASILVEFGVWSTSAFSGGGGGGGVAFLGGDLVVVGVSTGGVCLGGNLSPRISGGAFRLSFGASVVSTTSEGPGAPLTVSPTAVGDSRPDLVS